jgi:hypothetical protein
MGTPIWAIEGVALDSTSEMVPGSMADYLTKLSGHTLQFAGEVWYVATDGDDANGGRSPADSFLTIAHAISEAAPGDGINVNVGVYTEDINMSLAGLELHGEFGATLVGTLTVSADSCIVAGMIVSPTAAAGIVLTSNYCMIRDTRVIGTPTTAYDVNGYRNRLENCNALGHTVTSFDIASYGNQLYQCSAQGALAATRGFYLSNAAADDCLLESCVSVGNATASYELATGTTQNALYQCASGGGDGPFVDNGTFNTRPGFTFDSVVVNSTVLDGSGTYNIFQVTGNVRVNYIWGHVTELIPAATTAASLQLFPTGGVAIQLTSLAGSDISNLPVGSLIAKGQLAANAIDVGDATLGFLSEQSGFVFASFAIGQKTATNTYIRLNVTEGNADGTIHWHCDWEPLSEDGWLEAA